MTDDTIHTCSYECERPGCIRAQRDELAARLTAETGHARGEFEYEYEVWQGDALQAGGSTTDYASAQSEASHYAMMYAQDGPVEVRIYEKRLLSADKVQLKRRRYDPYGSLSEYGIFPECDAQPPADDDDDEVVFIDGVGAARSDVKSCRDGVQWIRVGDRVYWPLSDSDAKRLHSACCGKGSFDGPTTPADDALLRQALEVLSRAHQTAMVQTLKARIPECAEFGGIAQDLDFVVTALRERLGEGAEP